MEAQQSTELPKAQSISVFTVVTTGEPVVYDRRLLVVIDKGKNGRSNTKRKCSGGDVENEDLDVAAGVEILEETNLRGYRREAVLLEIHKTSKDNPEEIHKDIFFLGQPFEETPPTPGANIAYAGWEPVKDVLRLIGRGGFVPNHAHAILWWLVRDEFLKTGNRERIEPILFDSNLLLIGLKERTLVLCFAPRCVECAKWRITGLMSPPAFFNQNGRFKIEKEKITEIEGGTYFILYAGTRFDDFVLLEASKKGISFLPWRALAHTLKVEDIASYAAKNFGGTFALIDCRKTEYGNIALLHVRSPLGEIPLTPVCISSSPGLNFVMYPEAWQIVNIAAPVLERYSFELSGRIHRPVVNRRWKVDWHDRIPEYIRMYDREDIFSKV